MVGYGTYSTVRLGVSGLRLDGLSIRVQAEGAAASRLPHPLTIALLSLASPAVPLAPDLCFVPREPPAYAYACATLRCATLAAASVAWGRHVSCLILLLFMPHAKTLPVESTVQSTAQHSTAQHSTAQHSTAQHSTARHSAAPTQLGIPSEPLQVPSLARTLVGRQPPSCNPILIR
ncbi:hypothetical protein K431DRAFT_137525 [Polychaeton citri CBS 116435]|uniref:Uncharacterized protein n=1 Tax=Polychaeton citri CBS 116435 TaxID=1314669 RepID=A0A9P4ULZ8_9PEZI|nr:hypothetical protein K431DRAFT_137525 [Polychaeton citri CBS 116435]